MTKSFLTALIILTTLSLSQAQYYEESQYSGVGIPFFDVSVSRQFSNDLKSSKVVTTAQILYDDLTFVKSDTTGFDAQIEWLVAVYDDDEKLVYSRTLSRSLNVADYSITNSRDERLILNTELSLPEGEYELLMRMVDLVTKKSSQRRVEIEIDDFADGQVAVSDILFLRDVALDSTGSLKFYIPIFGNNFTLREGYFFLYFTIYSQKLDTQARLKFSFLDQKKRAVFDTVTTKMVRSTITSHILKVEKERFEGNRYIAEVNVEIDGNEAESRRNFTFFWKNVPTNVEDIDIALKQMIYILNPDSLDRYEDADLEEKQKFFKRFWRQRDPNPSTKKNELMDEYFKRVNYANQSYSGFNTQGWKTDRGRIFIKFGPPDDIERHPFELNTRPYEIWRYYALRKVFLFEDYTGFGDYRLHPEYVNVEYQ